MNGIWNVGQSNHWDFFLMKNKKIFSQCVYGQLYGSKQFCHLHSMEFTIFFLYIPSVLNAYPLLNIVPKQKKNLFYSYFHQLSCMCVWKVVWLYVFARTKYLRCVFFFSSSSVVDVSVLNCHQRDCQLITQYTIWMKKAERCKRKYDRRNEREREKTVLSLDSTILE